VSDKLSLPVQVSVREKRFVEFGKVQMEQSKEKKQQIQHFDGELSTQTLLRNK